jgi:methionine aminopeptidase
MIISTYTRQKILMKYWINCVNRLHSAVTAAWTLSIPANGNDQRKKFPNGLYDNLGTGDVELLDDDWTVVTADGKASAHWEHTIAVFSGHTEILTED